MVHFSARRVWEDSIHDWVDALAIVREDRGEVGGEKVGLGRRGRCRGCGRGVVVRDVRGDVGWDVGGDVGGDVRGDVEKGGFVSLMTNWFV